MECLKEKIENLYLELSYVRLELELMKEIDKKTNCSDEKIIKKNEELILTLKDSLWYAIIMRLAKICEDDTQVNSIYKIFNCCSTNPIVVRKKIISEKELLEMKIKVISAITDESENNINLIKGWRDKYLAHYSKLVTPKETQEVFLMTEKRLDYIIVTLLDVLKKLIEKFNINIDDIYMQTKTDALKNEFNIICDLLES